MKHSDFSRPPAHLSPYCHCRSRKYSTVNIRCFPLMGPAFQSTTRSCDHQKSSVCDTRCSPCRPVHTSLRLPGRNCYACHSSTTILAMPALALQLQVGHVVYSNGMSSVHEPPSYQPSRRITLSAAHGTSSAALSIRLYCFVYFCYPARSTSGS
jgi:hypothetical protein